MSSSDEAGIRARWTRKLAERRKALTAARGAHNKALAAVRAAKRVLARHPAPKPSTPTPPAPARLLWHPTAKRVIYSSAGAFLPSVPARGVLHTTEGGGLPTYSGSAPHFTLDPKTGDLWQHMPVNECAKALEHRAGTIDTNRMHAIQVEIIGYADSTLAARRGQSSRAVVNFGDIEYGHIADLMRWIERNTGVQRRCSQTFEAANHPMSDSAWRTYSGWCGHQHVPGQAHWDPGLIKIGRLI